VKAIGIKTDKGYEFYIKRNCSISPTQLAVIFLFLGLISTSIGTVFYIFGATLILPFSFLEVFALVAAYFYNAMHANDFERLTIENEYVLFESKFGRKYRKEKFIKSLTRVLSSEREQLVHLTQGLNKIHFGKNLHLTLRSLLETEVRNSLKIKM
jgi:uncharacterized membrane protein